MTANRDLLTDEIARARHSPAAPSVSDFDFKGWKTAKPILLSRYWSGKPVPATRETEVRTLWSDDALHILYNCQQHEPLTVASKPQTDTKAIGLWERDVCEIFIAPDPATPECYFEFEGAPTGEWLDVGIRHTKEGRQSDWRFKSGLTVAAEEREACILISLRIPWGKQIPKPGTGTRWRANFFRCVGSGESRGYLTWQPTFTEEPNFHVPGVFGWLKFE
jgi:hypothetical protein